MEYYRLGIAESFLVSHRKLLYFH